MKYWQRVFLIGFLLAMSWYTILRIADSPSGSWERIITLFFIGLFGMLFLGKPE